MSKEFHLGEIEREYEIEDFELRQTPIRKSGKPAGGMPVKLFVGIGGVVVLITILLVVLFSGNSRPVPDSRMIAALESRLDKLETSLATRQGPDTDVSARFADYDHRIDVLGKRLERLETAFSERTDYLKQEILALKSSRNKAPVQKKAAENKEKAARTAARYHKVTSGETLYRISRRYGLSVDDLRRYNDLPAGQAIYPGQKLIVSR